MEAARWIRSAQSLFRLGCLLVAIGLCVSLRALPLLAQDGDVDLERRIEAARTALIGAFEAGAVKGQFIERRPGAYQFAPADRALAIVAVANPEAVSFLAADQPVHVKGQLDAAGRRLTVDRYDFRHPDPPPTPPAGAAGALAAMRALDEKLGEIAQPGQMSVAPRHFDPSTDFGRGGRRQVRKVLEDYSSAVVAGDLASADAIAREWPDTLQRIAKQLPDEPDLKAVYGHYDNYASWRYDRIFSDAAAVVAIAEPSTTNQALCSGVLIAEDLVLTAGHCFIKPPEELEVWFGFADWPDGSRKATVRRRIVEAVAPPPETWPEVLDGRFSHTLYDYAIVRFAAPSGEPLLPDLELLPGRTLRPMPQCIRESTPQRGDAVYVVGYPRGAPLMVHDNGRVEWPFRILEDKLAALRIQVHAEVTGEAEATTILKEFDDSYADRKTISGINWRYFFDVRENGQPRMGIVSDTFHGNSGGPVFDHERDQCVVGILNTGLANSATGLVADWRVHERVLPARAILDDLKADPATTRMLTDGTLRLRP